MFPSAFRDKIHALWGRIKQKIKLGGSDMRRYRAFFLCLLLSGCVSITTLPDQTFLPATKTESRAQNRPLTRIDSVRAGMTYSEAAAVMGEKVTIGYEQSNASQGAYTQLTITHPYRKEFFQHRNKTYDVFYYFTRINQADGVISEDELTPLVFEKNVLVGKGWDFLNQLKNNSGPGRYRDI